MRNAYSSKKNKNSFFFSRKLSNWIVKSLPDWLEPFWTLENIFFFHWSQLMKNAFNLSFFYVESNISKKKKQDCLKKNFLCNLQSIFNQLLFFHMTNFRKFITSWLKFTKKLQPNKVSYMHSDLAFTHECQWIASNVEYAVDL